MDRRLRLTPAATAPVAGIDWSPRGWVAVTLGPGGVRGVVAGRDLAALVAGLREARAIGVDMPIGLPAGERAADALARRFVGPRGASVFATPPRAVLDSGSHAAATAKARELIGKGISQQAWALRHTIREVEAVAARDARLVEVHPEVSFTALAGAPPAFAKTTWNGQMARRALLEAAGVRLPAELAGEAGRVPAADVLDAAVAAWSAARYAAGEAGSFPAGAAPGRREVIWY